MGSTKRIEAEKRLDEVISQRKHVDESVQAIANVLFEDVDAAHSYLTMVRPAGQPLVDDWDCLKTMVCTTSQDYLLYLYQLCFKFCF